MSKSGSWSRRVGDSLLSLPMIVVLAVSAHAQTKIGYSTVDAGIFGGGQFFQLYQGQHSRPINYDEGGVFGVVLTQDPWQHFGIEESFSFGRSNLRATVLSDPRVTDYGMAGRNYNLAVTGLFYFTPRESKWRPFLTIGPGVTFYRVDQDFAQPPGGPAEHLDMKYGPALVYGGGLKYNGWRRVGLRADVRDTYTRSPHYGLPSFSSIPGAVYLPQGGTEHALTATLGLTLHLRIHDAAVAAPPPPPTPAPVPAPAAAPPPPIEIATGSIGGARDVCPGESLRFSANPRVSGASPSYQWMVDGQPVSGATGTSFDMPASGSGSKSVALRVTAGGTSKVSDPVNFRVKDYRQPAVRFNPAPSTLAAGASLPVTASATGSECGDPVRLSYSASEGSYDGNNFDSTGVNFGQGTGRLQTKVVHLTATATDRTGATATATKDVTVTSKPVARRLDDLVFPANNSRVNNCAKRLLLEVVTPALRDDPNAKVVLIGHRDAKEKGAGLDRARVLNAAAVLSAGTGICPQLELSRVQGAWVGTDQSSTPKPSFCGTSTDVKERSGQAVADSDSQAQFRRVEVWIVPSGAEMPAGVKASDLPAPTVKALGCPR